MTLSDLSIKRPVFAWMIMAALIVFGAISFGRLGVSQMPDVDFPVLSLTASWEGAAPEVMESEIAEPLEQAVISVEGIRDITSKIRQGNATIEIEFELNRNIDAALQEVQAAVSRVRLPLEVDLPTIQKSNPDDEPIMWLGIASTERSLHELIVYVDLNIQDQFQILPGVGQITLGGFAERNLRLWVDNEKLKKYELTILDLQRAIETEHTEAAAGYIENDKQELNLRIMGEGRTPEEIGNILINQRGGRAIYDSNIRVKDVARVEDSLNDIRRVSRISGVPGLGIGIRKQRGSNAVAVAETVKKRMEELNQTLPKDIKISVNFDSTVFIKHSVEETEFTLILSAIVTGLVCWLFLGSWNSTFNVLLSIPTSVIGTFIIMYFMGFTLNMFTLLGLALAVGIVVDDAIMVLENIFRHIQMGKDRVSASRDGAREITFAAVAATVAVMAIFLPVAFMKGIIGKFFFQFGVTISGAVALSLLEAITLTPMRCSQFLKYDQSPKSGFAAFTARQFEKLAAKYKSLLSVLLNHRWKVTLGAILFFLGSLAIGFFLRWEMIPEQDQGTFIARFETPVGSSLAFTSDKIKEAEKLLKNRPEVLRFFASIGGFGGGESNKGILFVTLKPRSERTMSQRQLMDWCREEMSKIPKLRVTPTDLASRGFSASRNSSSPVNFNIRGNSYGVLKEKSREMIDKLNETGLYKDLDTDYREGMPEIRVWPDREKASASAVSIESINQTINAAIGGVRQGRFTQGGRRYDVRLRLNPEERLTSDQIENLQVRTAYGELIPIKNVIRTETVPTLQTITRRMRERSITVSSSIAAGRSQGEALNTVQAVGKQVLPEGYRLFFSGTAQTFREAIGSLLFAFILGLIVAYMVLAAQFNSFIHPITVLIALPFSISGAVLALLITNQTINLYSGIGLILLAGIVKKNSILLVEFTNKKRYEDGLSSYDALLNAAPIRLRPILMTSFSTIAAAIPPALALGPGAESRIPMAVTVIGGVLVSTFLTLLVVPCAYSLMTKLERPFKTDSKNSTL
jgi:hydrophobe/amphiphile efflux-1 (HAE1) family protein